METDPTPKRRKGLTVALAISAVAGIGLLAGQGFSPVEASATRSPEQIYGASCKYCHGHMVAPGVRVAPDLLGRKLDPESIKLFVRNGPGGMLSFRESDISNRELDALARWISQSPAPPAPPMPPTPAQQPGKSKP
ncbi:MAG: 4-cresol dehydrogenase [hydroxylating] cytochrome c subunit precursor [Pseudomonadota bacterium]